MTIATFLIQRQSIFGKQPPQLKMFAGRPALVERRGDVCVIAKADCAFNVKVLSASFAPDGFPQAEIVPLDVVIGWHSASLFKDGILHRPCVYFEDGNRVAEIEDCWMRKTSQIHICYAPGTTEIERLYPGDDLIIEGFLVDLVEPDGTAIWRSDTNFTDGAGHCETICAINWEIKSKRHRSVTSGERVAELKLPTFKPVFSN